jgi:hypothetical protein
MTLKPSSPSPDPLAEALTAYQYNDVTGTVAINVAEALLAIATAIDRLAAAQERVLSVQERLAAAQDAAMVQAAQRAEMLLAMVSGQRGHA